MPRPTQQSLAIGSAAGARLVPIFGVELTDQEVVPVAQTASERRAGRLGLAMADSLVGPILAAADARLPGGNLVPRSAGLGVFGTEIQRVDQPVGLTRGGDPYAAIVDDMAAQLAQACRNNGDFLLR